MRCFVPVVITRPLTLKKFVVTHKSKAEFVMDQKRLFSLTSKEKLLLAYRLTDNVLSPVAIPLCSNVATTWI
jgi:hypothetical protein